MEIKRSPGQLLGEKIELLLRSLKVCPLPCSVLSSSGTEAECVDGEVITIRGVEYVAHNDELPLPDDIKGETKIDAEGRLKGGKLLASLDSWPTQS